MRNVLVIEDEPNHILLITVILQIDNYHIIPARTATEAIDLAHQHNPKLILCDLVIPDMDIWAIIRCFREIPTTRTTPILLMSGFVHHDIHERAVQAGCDGFISKPFSADKLRKEVNQLVGVSRLSDQNNSHIIYP